MINPEPRAFDGVKGYIANNGANITPGFYRNYHYNTDNTNDNVYIHQVRPKADMYSGSLFLMVACINLKNGQDEFITSQNSCHC